LKNEFVIILVIAFLFVIFLYFIEPFITRQKLKNNNEHGSARWSNKKDIKRNFSKEKIRKINTSGFPIYFSNDNKNVWFDNKTPHWIYLGGTGSGKSTTAVIPQCSFIATAKKKKSVFITDPKGEIFSTTSKLFKDNGYNILTLDFRNPSKSNHLNILEPIIKEYELYLEKDKDSKKVTYEEEKVKLQNESISHLAECNQLISSLSNIIMQDKTAREVFWNNSASDLLYGFISLFLEDYGDGKIKREQITMTSIKKFQNSSSSDSDLKLLKKYIEKKDYGLKSKDKLLPLITTSENTFRSITSIFNERMSLFDDINVENITANSDFDFDILGKEPTVLYCCIPDESKVYYSLISIIVSLIYKTLVVLCNNQPNKKLPYDLIFLLDEFANTPPLEDIETIVSVARSRGMQFQFFIQSFAQLDNLYGREVSQIIQDNCGLAYLKTNSQSTAEEISRRLGNQTIESSSINYSMSLMSNNGSKNTSLISRCLLTADEIKQLHFKTIIFSSIGHPVFRDTIMYDKFSCYKSGFVERNIRPLERLTKTYYTVEKLKFSNNTNNDEIKKKLENILNEIMKLFGNIDYDIEYEDDKAHLYLAPPLSMNDLIALENLSKKLNFYYSAISNKEEINRKNRTSKIEVALL